MRYQTYSSCYRCLGLKDSASWEVVQLAYRRRVSYYHPDRNKVGRSAAGGAVDQNAEFRRVVAAYRCIAQYRKSHGALPESGMVIAPARIPGSYRQREKKPPRKQRLQPLLLWPGAIFRGLKSVVLWFRPVLLWPGAVFRGLKSVVLWFRPVLLWPGAVFRGLKSVVLWFRPVLLWPGAIFRGLKSVVLWFKPVLLWPGAIFRGLKSVVLWFRPVLLWPGAIFRGLKSVVLWFRPVLLWPGAVFRWSLSVIMSVILWPWSVLRSILKRFRRPRPGTVQRFIKAGLWSGGTTLLLAVTAAFLFEMISRGMELQNSQALTASAGTSTSASTSTAAITVAEPVRSATPEQAAGTLEIGISPSEVLRRIGVPTRTKGDTWYYGNSGIVFANGCVAGWDDRPPYPLGNRASPVVDPDLNQARGITCR